MEACPQIPLQLAAALGGYRLRIGGIAGMPNVRA
jgi:hypothetical protein